MRTWRTAAAATLLVLLSAVQGASPPPTVTLTATEVQVDDGLLSGGFAGLFWMTPQGSGLQEDAMASVQATANKTPTAPVDPSKLNANRPRDLPLPHLLVEAAEAHVTLYEQTTYAYAPPGPQPEPRYLDLTGFRMPGGAIGDDDSARLMVMPLEGAVGSVTGGFQVRVAQDEVFPRTGSALGADYGTFHLDGTALAHLAEGTVEATGSFRLILDAIDAPYGAHEGDGNIVTRRGFDDRIPEEVPQTAAYGTTTLSAHATVREAVIDLRGARLVLADGEAYLGPTAALSASSLDVAAVAGQAAGQAAGGQSIHAEGDLDGSLAVVQGAADRLAVDVGGTFHRLRVGAQDVALPAPSSSAAASPALGPSGLALALLAIPLLPAAQWAASRRRFTRMDRALDRGDFAAALRLSGRFTPWPGQRQDGVLAAAICLIGLGRSAEACERLEAGRRWSASRRPMRDFLRARGHAALGRSEEATAALAASLLAEPALIAQARSDPVLAALVDGSKDPERQEAYA